jgi:PAS domain S-box-containing protein
MRLSTTHQIAIGCGAALLIFVLLGEIARRTANTVGEGGEMATRAQSVLFYSEGLAEGLEDADRAVRDLAGALDPNATADRFANYVTATSRIRENLDLLNTYALTDDLPHHGHFVSVTDLVESKLGAMRAAVEAREGSPDSADELLDSSEALTGRLRSEIEELQRVELDYMANETRDDSFRARRAQYAVLLVTVGAAVLLTVGAALMIGDLNGRRRAEARLRASEERFRTLAANAPIGVFLTDRDGLITFVNDRHSAITGRETEDVSGEQWTEVLHPEDRDAVATRWQKAGREDRDFGAEYRSIRPDGRVVWLYGRSAALRDEKGAVTGFVGTVSDITDRKLAESERDRFFSLSLDLLSITDFHGNFRRFNPAWSNILGFTPDELRSRRLVDLVHPADREATERETARLKRGGAITGFEHRLKTKDGTCRWLSWNAASDMDHKLIYSIARDVTEGRELQEQLRQKNQELERQNKEVATATRLKSEFLANMSHELRTPLNGIIGFAEVMRDGHGGPVTEAHEEFLDDILLSSRHLLRLINDILDLAKVEAGKLSFRPEKVGLEGVAREAVNTLREMAARNRIELAVEVDPSLSQVELDPARLRQVLYNYISNALKFTDAGGKVVVRATSVSGDMFRLEVQDSGIGIRPEDIPKLFSEFHQLDEGSAKKYQGTGLGLALTKRIVEAQGGSVGVSSRWGEGSTFYAVLPTRSTVADEGVPPAHPRRSQSLLIVVGTGEADPQLTTRLARHALEAQVVTRGTEAMELAAARDFDGIVLDLTLPDMDGKELLEAIRNTERQRSTPIVAVTSNPDRRIVPGLRVQAFLERPVQAESLIDTLRRAGVPVSPRNFAPGSAEGVKERA